MTAIKAVDKVLFESVYITHKHIVIGKSKLLIDGSGLFNQLLGYFDRVKRKQVFIAWLCSLYDVKQLTDEHKKNYEQSLFTTRRSTIYAECLRIKYRNDNGDIDFYGISNGNQLSYLTSIQSSRFYSIIHKYLKFNKRCKAIARSLGYSVASLTSVALKREIDECLEDDNIPEIKDIKVLTNKPNEICLAYFNLDNLPSGNTPAWDSFLSAFANPEMASCFMAAVYSIFVGTNRSRQIIYLFGSGNAGKSVVARTVYRRLESINSGICTTLESLAHQDKFSAASYENRQLVMCADNNDLGLLRSTLVKNITGNDYASARRMGQDKEEVLLFSRMIVTSNRILWCNTDKPEELSRVLIFALDATASLEASKQWDHTINGDWASCLYDEMDIFIGKCKQHYDQWLSEDGHNLRHYDGMIDILMQGEFFIQRDMRNWWNSCIKPYSGKNKTNVLTFTELRDDFNRFIHPMNSMGKFSYSIKRFMPIIIREQGVRISQLDVRNEYIIEGYEFIKKDPTKRITALEMTQSEVNDINSGKIEISPERYV
jgi:hypothetical protein